MSEKPTPSNNSKAILLVCRHAPYGNSLARESLETALAAGALGAKVSMLFLDEGVWQLTRAHSTKGINSKNHSAVIGALALYDVEPLLVDQASLERRGIDAEHLSELTSVINAQAVKDALATYDVVLSF